jgi:predicted unusual protein kinase regulating ubiquinone biosynthesis (AarF/ABC1/UbiB family)
MMGNVAGQGLKELGSGRRPALPQLLMSPQNISLLARKLAKMRGAAMKLGQLLSMDSGDFLPSELAMILQRLRAEADFMPPKQLRDVLNQEWGMGWMGRFSRFDGAGPLCRNQGGRGLGHKSSISRRAQQH